MNKSNTTKYIISGLIAAFLFGGATPASKALLGAFQAQTLAGLLYLGAALGVLPLIIKEKTFQLPWRAGKKTLLLIAGATFLGGILGPLLLLLGLRTASSGSVSLWLNLEFVATVFLGHFIFREQLNFNGWIAAVGTLIAAVLLAGDKSGGGIVSGVLVFLGCVCWGGDNHFTALIDGISPAQTTLWKGLIAGVFNLVIGVTIAGGISSSPNFIILALLVGVASYGLSITLYVTSAQGLGAVRSQMIFSTAPFFGLLISVTLLGETLTGFQIIAALIITASLIVMFKEKHTHLHQHHYISHQHRHHHDDLHHDHDHDGIQDGGSHIHRHDHHPKEHSHRHWPDLHHRHSHTNKDDS